MNWLPRSRHHRDLHSFPTRRSSDLVTVGGGRKGDRFTEAEAGRRYLQSHGATDVIAVPVGKNTLESLKAVDDAFAKRGWHRSEEHTSELQSHVNLVCRLLLEKKNIK